MTYWTVRQNRVGHDWRWEVWGAGGERVTLDTTRWYPDQELHTIAAALNALAPYRHG